jgi:hypothetical protein
VESIAVRLRCCEVGIFGPIERHIDNKAGGERRSGVAPKASFEKMGEKLERG